jgi:hypothetical protein
MTDAEIRANLPVSQQVLFDFFIDWQSKIKSMPLEPMQLIALDALRQLAEARALLGEGYRRAMETCGNQNWIDEIDQYFKEHK